MNNNNKDNEKYYHDNNALQRITINTMKIYCNPL